MPQGNYRIHQERKLDPVDARELFQVLCGVDMACRLVTQWLDHQSVDELQFLAERYLETLNEKDQVEAKLRAKLNPVVAPQKPRKATAKAAKAAKASGDQATAKKLAVEKPVTKGAHMRKRSK